MNETKFKLHTDCDFPCIHLEVYINDELISDTEADIVSQINFIDSAIINNYNNELNKSFNNICEETKTYFGNSIGLLEQIKKLEIVQRKKTILNFSLNERDNNV